MLPETPQSTTISRRRRVSHTWAGILIAAVLNALAGCAHRAYTPSPVQSEVPTTDSIGRARGIRIAELAMQQIGQPYHFGGETREGFDCSGLSFFVHAQLGIDLPRTAVQQRQASAALDITELLPGDLVFFTMGKSLLVDHVGIYVGNGRFVHAPHPGAAVTSAAIADRWHRARFAGGGRFWAQQP